MKKLRLTFCALCAALATPAIEATTVIPPSFDELVAQAELIFQGTVTEVRSQWVGEGGQRHIVSYVTLNVDDALKGELGGSYTVRMLGGTVDGQTMEVSDSPKFKVGDRDILFVEHNGTQFIPLVGIMHGRFRLQKDNATGAEVVVTNSGRAVTDLAQLGKDDDAAHSRDSGSSSTDAATASKTLDSDSFKAAIKAKLASGS